LSISLNLIITVSNSSFEPTLSDDDNRSRLVEEETLAEFLG